MKQYYLITVLVFMSCNCFSQNEISSQTYLLRNDTILPKGKLLGDDSFYSCMGLIISNDYKLMDSISFPLNKKERLFIVILSPLSQELFYFDDVDQARLAVVFVAQKQNVNVKYINQDLILSNREFNTNVYRGIKKNRSGFSLSFSFGSVNKCEYKFSFKLLQNNFFLYSQYYNFYKSDLSKSYHGEIVYKNWQKHNLKDIRIHELIKEPNW